MGLSELWVPFHFLTGTSISVCIGLNSVTTSSSFLSAVSIHCSWCIAKDPGREEVHGRILSQKCSARPGKWLPQGFLMYLNQPWPCPELSWPTAAEQSWCWQRLSRLTALECPFWMGCCSTRDACRLILTSHKPDDSPMKAEKHLGLWGLKLTFTPSRQALRQEALQNKNIACSPTGWRTWTRFSELLQRREQIGLVEKISVWVTEKQKLLQSDLITCRLGSVSQLFC